MLGTKQERLHNYRENMRTFFGSTVDLYYEHWGDFLHLAIFEPGDDCTDYAGAFDRTHERYWQTINGPGAKRILELATGAGAFAAWMSRRGAAEIVGIDICDVQLGHARKRMRKERIDNVKIIEHDIMELNRLEEPPFDAVVYLDAACYLPDRRKVIHHIASQLNPGGRVLLVDWCRPGAVSFLEQELILDPFYRYWSIPEMETVEGYKRAFDSAGLTMIEFDDLSKKVMPNWVSGCDKACQSLKDPLTADKLLAIAKATARFGPLGLQYAKDQFYAVAFARLAADAGLLQYCLFVAEKKLV